MACVQKNSKKVSENRHLGAKGLKLGFSCTLVMGTNKKFMKWSLISLTIVPTSFVELNELVIIWSIRDIEMPCIPVALVINWRNPLLIIVSTKSILCELSLSKLMLSSRVTNYVRPVADILSRSLSNSLINSLMALSKAHLSKKKKKKIFSPWIFLKLWTFNPLVPDRTLKYVFSKKKFLVLF